MTLDEALAELGVGHDAGADQARRAYLRLLRTRKPETDPQGFMRLREAYEQVKAHLEWRDAFFGRIGVAVGQEAAPAPPPKTEERTEEASPPAPPPEAEDQPKEAPPPAPPPEAEDRPKEAPPPAPVPAPAPVPVPAPAPAPVPVPEVVAPAEEPEHDQEEEEWNRARERADRSRARERADADHEHADDHVDEGEDDHVDEEEEEDEEPEEEGPSEARVDVLRREGRYSEAGAEMGRLFDAATETIQSPPPPILKALDLLVQLHAKGEVAAAKALHRSVKEWLQTSGQEARVLRGDSAARWSMLRELAALPAGFPGPVRSAIGNAMAAGDLGRARNDRDLTVFRGRLPRAARAAGVTLRDKAPLLAAALADTLDPPPPRAAPVAQGSGKGGWAFGVVAIALLRIVMLFSRESSSHSYDYKNPVYNLPPRIDLTPFTYLDGGLYIPSFDAGAFAPSKLDAGAKRSDTKGKARIREGGTAVIVDAGRCGGTGQP